MLRGLLRRFDKRSLVNLDDLYAFIFQLLLRFLLIGSNLRNYILAVSESDW